MSFLDACGVETGLDPGAVLAAARDVAALAGVTMTSRAAVVGTRADFLRLGAKVDRQ